MGGKSSSETKSDYRPRYEPAPGQRQFNSDSAPIVKVTPEIVGSPQRVLNDDLAATILEALPPKYQPFGKKAVWFEIFNTSKNGKSFQRLVQLITERGPTVIVIQVKNSTRIIGAFCDSPWLSVSQREKLAVSSAAAANRARREGQNTAGLQQKPENQNNVFFGAEPCFVFCAGGEGLEKVDASGKIYVSRSFANSNFMYLFDTHPQEDKVGFGMGGQPGYFGWFIDRWLENGQCKGEMCSTFRNPRLSETEDWEIGAVEVYAVSPEFVQQFLSESQLDNPSGRSVLTKNPDTEADKLILELHGVHTFGSNERPDV